MKNKDKENRSFTYHILGKPLALLLILATGLAVLCNTAIHFIKKRKAHKGGINR